MVYSNQVLHWCQDKDLVFKQVHRILKPGGKFGFLALTHWEFIPTVFTSDMVSPEFEKAARNMMRPLPMEEYKRLISTNNFEIVHLEQDKREWKFVDVHKLIETMRVDTFGEFDTTHFKVDVMKRHYGEGEIKIVIPFCIVVMCKI